MPRVILVASKTGYQVREFHTAAEKLGIELVFATDRCHVLDDPWGDRAAAVRFDDPEAGIEALQERGPFDGIVAVGDRPACAAAEIAARLGLRFHSAEAVRAASDKFVTRERLRQAGLNVPEYRLLGPDSSGFVPRFPCVVKPLHLSGSRGVIRANTLDQFGAACARVRAISRESEVLVEDFIPGIEFALEGVVTGGRLQVLAIFDKPDPLDGPFFEETIYVTPPAQPERLLREMEQATQQAVDALGLTDGPVHAEMRVNTGVWILEAAARPIGGLCARILRFAPEMRFEELLLRHASGDDVSSARLAPGVHGVMMIPIPQAGVFSAVSGMESAIKTADIEAIEITAKEGQRIEPLPEGASYLGFIFARAGSRERIDRALTQAHQCLRFEITQTLPVVT